MSRWSRASTATVLAVICLAGVSSASAQEQVVRSGEECSAEAGAAVLSGLVRDLLTGNPMPGAAVRLRSEQFGQVMLGVALTDAEGAYRFCDVPQIPGLSIRAEVEAMTSRAFTLPDPPGGTMEPIYIEWSTPVDIVGTVVDAVSGEPVSGATVTLLDRGARSTSNDAGVFRIQGQGAGRLVMTTSVLGYAPRTDTLDTTSGDLLALTIVLGAEPILLDPIEVRVRAAPEAEARALGSRFDMMTLAQVDSILPRVLDFASLVRNAYFPGIRVSTLADGTLCIGTLRGGPDCAMVEVYLDGLRLSHAETVLTSLDPAVVESLQYLDSFEARIRYMGPRVHNGVLLIITRSGRRRGTGPGGAS